jgi:glyoxylase-like metal-dependent hydrolase (beta-lactamase superfamily II)
MNGGVQPSALGTQPIGGIARVLEDAYQLKLPVPFPLKFIASYLVEGRSGWTVIDPGFDYPAARRRGRRAPRRRGWTSIATSGRS